MSFNLIHFTTALVTSFPDFFFQPPRSGFFSLMDLDSLFQFPGSGFPLFSPLDPNSYFSVHRIRIPYFIPLNPDSLIQYPESGFPIFSTLDPVPWILILYFQSLGSEYRNFIPLYPDSQFSFPRIRILIFKSPGSRFPLFNPLAPDPNFSAHYPF